MRLILLGCFLAVIAMDAGFVRAADPGAAAGPTTAPAAPDQSADDAAKNADVHKLLEISGSGKIGAQVAKQLIAVMSRSFPNVPQKAWDEMSKEFNANDMIDLIVPIYAKHFTHDEIKQLIAFYETPIGKRLVAEQPGITSESMQVGQAWGQQVAMKMVQKLKDEGYIGAGQ